MITPILRQIVQNKNVNNQLFLITESVAEIILENLSWRCS